MAVSALRRLAAGAPARVFPVIGEGSLTAVEDLSPDPPIALCASPRQAEILRTVATGWRSTRIRPNSGHSWPCCLPDFSSS